MLFAQNSTESECIKKINNLVTQIENNFPGVLVFNFHPQNINSTTKMHKAVLKIAKRKSWIALTISEYLDWLQVINSITVEKIGSDYLLKSDLNREIKGITLNFSQVSSYSLLKKIFSNRKNIPKWISDYKVKN